MSIKDIFSRKKSSRAFQDKSPYAEGTKTQYPGANKSNRRQLTIGLDFGTAFTKVVVSDSVDNTAIPLRQHEQGIDRYLLPTVLWVANDGMCSIDQDIGIKCTDLKMLLLFEGVSVDAVLKASAYLAIVLRLIRSYILHNRIDRYGGCAIDWYINIGVPTDSYHDLELVDVYRSVIQRAWKASCNAGDITLDGLKNILHNTNVVDESNISDQAIEVIPEFVAQVTGYVRSPLRQDDLHMLIDVGAGTLDATIFNVHQVDGDDKFPIFAKSVEHLGTRFLMQHRLVCSDHEEESAFDPYQPVPDDRHVVRVLNISLQDLHKMDEPFKSKILKQILGMLSYTKKHRYPLSRKWQEGLPVFLCGGGSKSEFYRSLFINQDASMRPYPLNLRNLPELDNLDIADHIASDFDRLSVAYGLSFDALDIGDIIRQNEIEDVPPDAPRSAARTESVFCPDCNGTGGLHSSCAQCGGSGFRANECDAV